jgi:electron transfer flavoprotein beta subunit
MHYGTLQILAFGPPETKDGLKEAMAMGADSAIVLEDPSSGELDAQAAVEAVATAVDKLGGFDLILCGEASVDDSTYQFVPRLAERLGLPAIAYANRLTIEDGYVTADRNLEDRAETLKAPLPCVISVTEEINTPTKPTLMQVLQAKDKEITLWNITEDLGLSEQQLGAASGITAVSTLGFEVPRRQTVIKDMSAAEAVDDLLGLLEEEGVFE